jgi:hypothetical protein
MLVVFCLESARKLQLLVKVTKWLVITKHDLLVMQLYVNKQAKELIEDVILWLEKQRIPRDHIQAFHQTLSVGSSNTFCGFISLGHSIQTNCFKKPQWSIEALIQTIILK